LPGGASVTADTAATIPAARDMRGRGRKAVTEEKVMSSSTAPRPGSLSGLTDEEAREFHSIFMFSFVVFLVVAIIAHILAWIWRPWLPGVHGYQTGMLDHAHALVGHAITFLT
jgi:light-harvesting complex 1 beta chain